MTRRPPLPGPGIGVLGGILLLAVTVYANSVGNGFAYDDQAIIVENPLVTAGDPGAALTAPYWAGEAGVGRLYRPTTQAAFALQWRLFGGAPAGFHAVNVALHGLASVLVGLLCGWLAGVGRSPEDFPVNALVPGAALAGGALFAVHPVHVEAVANGVGQAELWAAVGVLGAVQVHLATRFAAGPLRIAGTLAVGVLFAVAFGAKEIAVTLPALLLAVEGAEAGSLRGLLGRLRAELPRVLVLAAVGVSMLVARAHVLGVLAGEDVTPVLWGVGPGERVLRVLPVWLEYLRLMVWPVSLSADYDPGVIYPAAGPSVVQVGGGALVLLALLALAVGGWRRARGGAVAAAWFGLAVLPVSNLLLPTGSIMAERTLYLPSVGLALGVAAVATAAAVRMGDGRLPRRAVWAFGGVLALLAAGTVARNPTWFSSFTVMETLARDHPESWRARMARAQGLARAGEDALAAEAYRSGVEALPTRFDLVSETGAFFKERGRLGEARPYLESAVVLRPGRPSGWILLTELELLEGRFREAHATAARGIGQATESGELWALLSEAYAGGGLLDASIRARRTALALEPDSAPWWTRLAELLEASGGDPSEAAEARRRAAAVGAR